ncbi:hypothetical protein MtrunA17_Chr4g0024931 [Medicago truncatula]|uniref:Uncharacterized protein n=1 Tax=Medicago truncatula TaxID=3880 RepID=A0A396I400_MEDTR|nr:hypothetical protein MtrunA17_Chr4g0024931 [Medicago truncatula]
MTALLPAVADPSRLIIILCNYWIVRRRKDRDGLWLSSRGLGCVPVYSGSGARLGGSLPPVMVVKVSTLVVRELRGA